MAISITPKPSVYKDQAAYGDKTYKPGMNLNSPDEQAGYDAAHTALVNNPDRQKTVAQKAYDKAYADAMGGVGGLAGNKDYATTQANTAFNATPYGTQQAAQLKAEQDARKTAQDDRHQTLLAERQASGLIGGNPSERDTVTRQGTGHGENPNNNGTGTGSGAGTAPAEDTTVAGRVQSIIAQNSPLMQQAAAQANQQSNVRGLINSDIAVGAAQGAVMDRATGIATQDAAAATQRLRDATQQGYTQSNMGLQQTFDLAKMDKQAAITLSQLSVQQQNDLAKMATQQGYNLQTMSAQQINDLQKMQTTQGYVQANMATGQTFDIAKMDKQAAITLSQMSQQQINDISKLATLQGYNVQNMTQQQINDMAKLNSAQVFQAAESLANATRQSAENALGRTFTAAENALNRTATAQLATTQATYQQLLTGSANATSIMNTAQTKIAELLANTTLDAPAKQAAIDLINKQAQTGLSIVGALAGDVDLSSYLNNLFG